MKTVANESVQPYFTSVGRNSKLLLNVPPTRDGLLHATDVARLAGCHDRLRQMFGVDLAGGKRVVWQRTGARTATADLDLGRDVQVTIVRLEEDVAKGQAVARYSLAGFERRRMARADEGATIGDARLDRFAPTVLRRIRLTIEEAVSAPEPLADRGLLTGSSSLTGTFRAGTTSRPAADPAEHVVHVAEIHHLDQVAVEVLREEERVAARRSLGLADALDAFADQVVVPLLRVADVERSA